MTILFTDSDRRRRKKLSASQAAKPQQSSQPPVHTHHQPYSSSSLAVPRVEYALSPTPQYAAHPNLPLPYQGYPSGAGYHPVYGPTPRMPQPYSSQHASPPLQPAQPYLGNSTSTFGNLTPGKEKEGLLKSHWHKAERLASRSCQDLSAQLSSGANKSVTMVNKTATMVTTNCIEKPTTIIGRKSVQALNQGAALCDRISSKLDAVITSIDGGVFSGKEQDLLVYHDEPSYQSSSTLQREMPLDRSAPTAHSNTSNTKGSNFFSKVWLYSNSRLPPHIPPFKVYLPTYPLFCLAATYSERVYTQPAPSTSEAETHIAADWRSGTKAMVLKSLPIDDMNTIVFAIRGSQTFMDWAVNYRSEPISPEGFLDDPGNLCHEGFLYVARKMVKPVAERLRVLLQENPARSNASLLITGHSAGGAVAALLYAHMMSINIQSELTYLTGFFKRIHCVTFGAPPVTLLPLKGSEDKRHRKSLFYSFINEGDPVPRADKAVVKSLLKLYSSPAPSSSGASTLTSFSNLSLSGNGSQATLQSTSTAKPAKSSALRKFTRPSKASLQTTSTAVSTVSSATEWPIAPCTLSPAGRLVVMRRRIGSQDEEDVEAVTVKDEDLRRVVYGDPLKHMMKVYKRRVEWIATRAVTASQY